MDRRRVILYASGVADVAFFALTIGILLAWYTSQYDPYYWVLGSANLLNALTFGLPCLATRSRVYSGCAGLLIATYGFIFAIQVMTATSVLVFEATCPFHSSVRDKCNGFDLVSVVFVVITYISAINKALALVLFHRHLTPPVDEEMELLAESDDED